MTNSISSDETTGFSFDYLMDSKNLKSLIPFEYIC